MRKQSTIATQEQATIDLTPMLDVVFIMLIFFIVTATFVKEPGQKVIRPEADTRTIQKRASILIAINRQNHVYIDRKKIDLPSIKTTIERLFLENPKGSVVIQADRDSNFETLTRVMNAARDLGIKNVAISADED